jgi:hypothetical protein|tara:strand:- start:211 stop:396 length:186 start_codon:yes stop_codon:yes gene_type:complete
MFSKGQIIFAIVFAISFVIIVTIAYRKDSKIHKKYYRGNLWVLLAFISFIGLIAMIKFIFT